MTERVQMLQNAADGAQPGRKRGALSLLLLGANQPRPARADSGNNGRRLFGRPTMATSPMSEASGVHKGGREKILFGCCCPSDVGSGCASMKMGISAADIYGVLMAALTCGISQIFTTTHYILVLRRFLPFNSYYTRLDIYQRGLSASSSPFRPIYIQTNTHCPTAACRCIARSRQSSVRISVQGNTQNSRPTSKRHNQQGAAGMRYLA
ncbi:hypothetical protein J3E69DRAFT_341962 [Trichoderma sp. SZMC 28015]